MDLGDFITGVLDAIAGTKNPTTLEAVLFLLVLVVGAGGILWYFIS